MQVKDERRSFLKYLFSLTAFIAGSAVSFNKNRGINAGKTAQSEALGMGAKGNRLKKIGVEEHCYTAKYFDWLYSGKTKSKSRGKERRPEDLEKLLDLGEGRLKEMDEAGIDMQILSLSFPDLNPFNIADAIAMAGMVNDKFSETVKQCPDKFSAFCCLPLQDPEAAADELERSVTELGLKGAMVNTLQERWFNDPKYEVLYERLERLEVPLFLHQNGEPSHIIPWLKNFIVGDLLEKYPNLRFILGHGGEGMPFWLWRGGLEPKNGKKSFKQKFTEHFYVATSEQRSDILLQFLIAALGAERILFATDYPYGSSKAHVDWIDKAPISDNDRKNICHLNSERLFKLRFGQ